MIIALRPVLLCLTAVGLLTAVNRSAVAGRNLLDKEGYADCPDSKFRTLRERANSESNWTNPILKTGTWRTPTHPLSP